ncbi:SDR family oxidoreductase [Novosphingobium sp. KCTC 2891]|uniref:SDR family NAD(P)-dependent oxidoreductase n=1 Tax=Novosphingobium sp. KCTC 2891 TaxID=2989730 RepID=UPI002222F1E5|nr:SDR family oxidoreductase [Novosphingobium sp. KCTC 2891]MCW1384413.1 SDR family oxidoreductase [Novosphingobium sp. KCTC 2891]
MELGLEGTVALVTGARGNIGVATCAALKREGVHVIASDVGVDEAAATDDGLEWRALDVTSEDDWARVIAGIETRHGRLDILVNNAGVAPTDRIDAMPLSQFRRAFDINVAGVFLGTQAASELMAKSGALREGGAAIINIASGAADKPAAFNACYCATKAAVRMFTRATAVEFSALGFPIRVNSVHPGAVESDMLGAIVERYVQLTGSTADDLYAAMLKGHPMGRLVKPDEVADGVVFLASRAARYSHAAALHVDGGNANT